MIGFDPEVGARDRRRRVHGIGCGGHVLAGAAFERHGGWTKGCPVLLGEGGAGTNQNSAPGRCGVVLAEQREAGELPSFGGCKWCFFPGCRWFRRSEWLGAWFDDGGDGGVRLAGLTGKLTPVFFVERRDLQGPFDNPDLVPDQQPNQLAAIDQADAGFVGRGRFLHEHSWRNHWW